MKSFIANNLGWYGAIAILLAFALINFAIITPNSSIYLVLNLTGSIGILINAKRKKDFPTVTLNAYWIIISFIALVRIF
ncbi:MAG: hypothetical protein COU28_02160 [Candidatus Magasanikbacteria bacterium CG10_big_fil_rev_8_21_14_0_10_36_16]|uniref:CBU-0592-like domain-containing protein n=1 Tax=Candidatus Magasanikbacteria bacterium CG10_big_fil_rev_8_21_14_0_10_36_16 TaxID=1974645 RepID=A0A2H0TYM3_9BACT|nr:MAG: hypothetical protein COU28_02160 [Candidatus Magasanikbacteria bacterium CG10_big_fil_rev_8_21_14_0_10_36_16]